MAGAERKQRTSAVINYCLVKTMMIRHSRGLGFQYMKVCVATLVIMGILALTSCSPRQEGFSVLPPTTLPTQTNLPRPTFTNIPKLPPTLPKPITPTGAQPVAIITPSNDLIERYSMLELDLQTTLQVNNPYNPDELDIKVDFTSPSGDVVKVGAFWMQEYDLQTRRPTGKPGWKVRFTPTETGTWSAVAYIPAGGVESESIQFQVAESVNPGFLRIHPSNPRYLAFDTGDFFFPIGVNMCWWGGGLDAVKEYGNMLDSFTQNGGNTIRVWMAAWSFGIEWNDTGLGNYDERQYEAWLLDQLFGMAKDHKVKIILVLMNHGPFSLYTNTEWEDNPYNAELGGPLDTPDQFATDPVAKAYYQRRINYIVNRWGYSPDLLAWEWFNEVNLTMISPETLLPWIQEMNVYLETRDVNHHLTSISYAGQGELSIWNMPEIDIIQKHEYALQENTPNKDLADRAVADFIRVAQGAPTKPILMGEFGYSAANYGDDVETTGIHLHNGLWATTFAGYAGTGMYWWWDVYIGNYNLWKHFHGVSSFLEGVDLASYTPFSPIIDGQGVDANRAVGLGLRGTDTLVWLRNNAYTVEASVAARQGTPASASYLPSLVDGVSLTLTDVTNGTYTVYWFDPQEAQWLKEQQLSAENHQLIIPAPSFRYDLAVKIAIGP